MFLTTTEAAKMLGVTTQTMYKWRTLKKGPKFYKIFNDRYRYLASEISSYINHQNNTKTQIIERDQDESDQH